MLDILTAILVIITGFYAYVTFKILRANEKAVNAVREQNEALTRPYISIRSSYLSGATYYLHIKNTGNTPAYNLTLLIDKDYYCFGDKKHNVNLKNTYTFSNTISSFAPESEIVYGLGHGGQLFTDKYDENITPRQFTITAKYSYLNKDVEEKTTIDLMQYRGTVIYSDAQVKELINIDSKLKDQNRIIEKLIDLLKNKFTEV